MRTITIAGLHMMAGQLIRPHREVITDVVLEGEQ